MVKVYIFNISEDEKNKESAPTRGGSPFAYFEKKASGESGARRELTLAEGELLHLALTDGYTKEMPDGFFEKDGFGKLKFTKRGKNNQRIEFSLAHAEKILVLAVSSGAAVGVDTEPLGRRICVGVESRFLDGFTPRFFELDAQVVEVKRRVGALYATEIKSPAPLPEGEASLRKWTAMEALVKMTGEGLSGHKKASAIHSRARLSGFIYEAADGKKYAVTLACRRALTVNDE